MIQSKQDSRRYCDMDRRALGIEDTPYQLLTHDVWAYERTRRRVGYCLNTGRNVVATVLARADLRRRSPRLGFSIRPNTFGPGLRIAHHGTIVVNSGARIGANCQIHVGASIGARRGFADAAPAIGDDAYIGPGAKIFGPITIGDRVSIGANAVVTKPWEDHGLTLVRIPATPLQTLVAEEPDGT